MVFHFKKKIGKKKTETEREKENLLGNAQGRGGDVREAEVVRDVGISGGAKGRKKYDRKDEMAEE